MNIKIIIGMIITVILISCFSGCITQELKPSEVAENDAQGLYEEGDHVTIRGFCCGQMMGTSSIIYYFTDGYENYKCIGEGINILFPSEHEIGKYYTIEIVYTFVADLSVHWMIAPVPL